MRNITAISGSLRSGSYNTALLHAAVRLAPEGWNVDIESLRGIPLYDGDLEATDGIPQRVAQLKERVASADALLIATPEYNHSIPGVLKNAIDWLSRPRSDIPVVFGGRPVALVGATPGSGGTTLSQAAWLPVFRTLGLTLWSEGELFVRGANERFDADGRLVDEEIRKRLQRFLAGFVEFVERRTANRVAV